MNALAGFDSRAPTACRRRTLWDAWFKISDAGYSSDREVWDRVADRLYPLVDEILYHRAVTQEGLALQVRALISAYRETWEPIGRGEEPQNPHTKAFTKCLFLDRRPVPAVR